MRGKRKQISIGTDKGDADTSTISNMTVWRVTGTPRNSKKATYGLKCSFLYLLSFFNLG